MSERQRWQDLVPRAVSGLAMAAAGAAVIWLGGAVLVATSCLLAGLMVWEAARMFASPAPVQDGLLGATAIALAWVLPGMFVLPVLVAAAAVPAARAGRDKPLCLAFLLWVLLACFAVLVLREHAGALWVLWLVAVIVTSDMAGYFVGRILGGPKFWPRISPKKTWSGTIAGWIGAALVGLGLAEATGAGVSLAAWSVVLALAGQMGDIAESALKRRVGIKDSSNLISGHGGVLDRFDALMGGLLLLAALWPLGLLPAAP